MKRLVKVAIFCNFLVLSGMVSAYVPDLFGAYQRGAEYARQQNAKDAYYYAQMQPRMYVEVYEQGKKKPKRNMQVSLKKSDVLCWQLYPIQNKLTYQTGEKFTLPYPIAMDTPFFGQAGNEHGTIHNAVQIDQQTYGFNRYMVSSNNSIGGCWVFNPYQNATPKGRYYIQVVIGEKDFKKVAFDIID